MADRAVRRARPASPTIARRNRIFSGCGKTSVVVDAKTGKVVATIANGDGVDALGWDPAQKLIYIPAGRDGNVTVVHQDSPDKYTVVATVQTMPGAKTITVDPVTHNAYLFQPEYGPAPAGAPPGPGGGRRAGRSSRRGSSPSRTELISVPLASHQRRGELRLADEAETAG